MNASHQDSPLPRQESASQEDASEPAFRKRTIPSEDLLAGDKEIWIRHGDAVYRLCETKSGKLILQK